MFGINSFEPCKYSFEEPGPTDIASFYISTKLKYTLVSSNGFKALINVIK